MKSIQPDKLSLGANLWSEAPASTARRPLSVRIVETLRIWRQRWQSRRQLVDLEDWALQDIGLTRHDVQAEYRKWFWQE